MFTVAFQAEVNQSLLDAELKQAVFSVTYEGCLYTPTEEFLEVLFSAELDEVDTTVLNDVMTAHNPDYITIPERIKSARIFGVSMIDKYQALMIGEGVVQAGAAHTVATKLRDSLILAQAGNLYALDAELAAVVPEPTFLEQGRINAIRNEVRAALGLPPI